jgi:hypothetical protein
LGNLDNDPALTNVGVRDVLGALNPWLPVRVTRGQTPPGVLSVFTGNDEVEYQRPWAFPNRTNDQNPDRAGNYLETPLTVAGPYLTDTMPDSLLALASPISNAARTLYQNAGCPSDTDFYNQAFVLHRGTGVLDGEGNFRATNPLGDPVVFSTYLIGQVANNPKFLSSFNLDADRGYGYLCWDWMRAPLPLPKGSSTPTDGMDNSFAPPLNWPEGAAGRSPGEPGGPADPPLADLGKPYWRRPKPAPVGENLYITNSQLLGLAVRLQYPGRNCKENVGGGIQ